MDVRRHGQAPEHDYADVPAAPAASGTLGRILAILLIIVSVVVLGWFGNKALAALTSDGGVKGKQYQAVFLTNGQVYFGKVSHVDSSYVKLTDIYYLQVQQQVQPKDNSSSQQPQVSLAKLGGELHGPEDVMYISRQQVLFWENLKNDGKVVKAIASYKAGGK
ncbi:MAG TPA: hypothetical protein VGH44_00205 [Candidatus Saccharimonadia bacterium]